MIFLELFWIFFKIGLFTIGGGYAMLPLIRQQVIGKYVTQELFLDMVAVSEATPGPFAINIATFIGMDVGYTYGGIGYGILGAISTTIAVILPSLIIVMIVTRLFTKFKTSQTVQGFLYGIRPVVVGLVISALLTVTLGLILPNINFSSLSDSNFKDFDYVSLMLIAGFLGLSTVKIKGKKINPLWLIGVSAVVGFLVFYVCKF